MTLESTDLLSPFGQSAVALDRELAKFESLSQELDRTSVQSDKGYEKALTLSKEINACRERMESGMRTLGQTLNAVQQSQEQAEKVIAARLVTIEERRQQVDSLSARFRSLGAMVHQINATVGEVRAQTAEALSVDERSTWMNRLPEFEVHMGTLVEEARKLMEEARSANMASLERNADALRKSLAAARNRVRLLVENQGPRNIENVH